MQREAEEAEAEAEAAAEASLRERLGDRFEQYAEAAKTRFGAPISLKDAAGIDDLVGEGTDLLPGWRFPEDMSQRQLAPYIEVYLNRQIDEALDVGYNESEDILYDIYEPDPDRGQAGALEDDGAGRAAEPGGAVEGATDARARGDADADYPAGSADPLADPTSEQSRAFDTDDGAGVEALSDSAWHDIRAEAKRTGERPQDTQANELLALEQADDAVYGVLDDMALKQGKELAFEDGLDSDISAELQQLAMAGADDKALRKRVEKLIKEGKLKIAEGTAPADAEIKPMPPSTVVPAPTERFYSAKYAGPLISQAEADRRLGAWKAMARAIGSRATATGKSSSRCSTLRVCGRSPIAIWALRFTNSTSSTASTFSTA